MCARLKLNGACWVVDGGAQRLAERPRCEKVSPMRAWWNYEAWDDLVRWAVGGAILVGLTALLAMLKALLGRRWARIAARTKSRLWPERRRSRPTCAFRK